MEENIQIKKITIIGLILNTIIAIIKLVVGFWGNSQAVIADAVHSFSDSSTDLVVIFGVKYWTAPPDASHPYGHKKIESGLTIVIGIILFFTALGLGYHAIESLINFQERNVKIISLVGPILSLIFKEILFHKSYKIGVKYNSSAVKANAWHHRTDALSSIPVLIAVVASIINPKLSYLDEIGAIVVAIFIIKLAVDIISKNFNELIDSAVEAEEMKLIQDILSRNPEVLGYHKVRSRKLGSSVFLDLHLEVDGELTVTKGHDIATKVKHSLINECPKIIDVVVHIEPKKK